MKNDEILVSVIVPVYNAEAYLKRCIDSLISQSLENIEFIIINDGSTDNSLNIIKSLVVSDKRFIIVDQPNLGVSSARNKGLILATGKYIMFVDSDDELMHSYSIAKLYEKIDILNADVLSFGSLNVTSNSTITQSSEHDLIFEISDDFIGCAKNTLFHTNYRTSVWNKIYRAEIIKSRSIQFYSYSDVISEDKIFNIHFFIFAKKIAIIKDIHYKYYTVMGSLSHSKTYNDVFLRVKKTVDLCMKYRKQLDLINCEFLFWTCFLDCCSICVELLSNYNNESLSKVKETIKKLIFENSTLINKYSDFSYYKHSSHNLKGMLYSILFYLTKNNNYSLAAFLLYAKSKIRVILIGKKG